MKHLQYLIIVLLLFVGGCGKNPKPLCSVNHKDPYGMSDKYGYIIYYDLEIAKSCSRNTGRPILLMFTCLDCYKALGNQNTQYGIEWDILMEADVKEIIEDNFILTVLFLNDQTPINKIDTTKKDREGKIITTVGQQNIMFQLENFGEHIMPMYIITNNQLKPLSRKIKWIKLEHKKVFHKFLKEGITNAKNNKHL